MEFLESLHYERYWNLLLEIFVKISPKIILALLTLYIGFKIANFINEILGKTLKKNHIEQTLRSFLLSVLGVILKILVIVTAVSMLGVQMSAFVALIGAAGLAVGLSLQGSLANFAGGVLIIFFKPFRVGDKIESQGHAGVVMDIQIFCTVLKTPNNERIIIPNGVLSNDTIINFTGQKKVRLTLTFGIGYNDDIKEAKEVLYAVIQKEKRFLADPKPFVGVEKLGESSIDFTFRAWCKTEDYWNIYFDIHEAVKIALDEAEISIPFPQRDIHLYENK